MRFGGIGRACVVVGVIILAFSAGACSRQPQQPKGFGLGGAAPATPGSPEDFAANVGDVVYFQGDSVVLTGHSRAILRQQVRWLNQHPQYQVMIAGHASEPGSRQHNLVLGAQRAMAVKSFLVRHGLRAGRLHTVSYGRERPVAACDDISCWSRNRRAQTVLTGGAVASY
ncbi:MAG: OmpA family protein [Alphaproteobacteria bacterium]